MMRLHGGEIAKRHRIRLRGGGKRSGGIVTAEHRRVSKGRDSVLGSDSSTHGKQDLVGDLYGSRDREEFVFGLLE